MFRSAELRKLVKAAGQPMKAMILLGVNCGFGNGDVGRLPLSALDLSKGWIDYPRPKTGVPRRCPLWPETVAALRARLKQRPAAESGEDEGLVFLTVRGESWHKGDHADQKMRADNPVSKETRKLLDKIAISGHRNFYALRHTFQAVGDESGDFLAVRSIMGHAGGDDIADHYREKVSDQRLRNVAEHVRRWLFGETKTTERDATRRRGKAVSNDRP
jgi:integrase